jgi:DNA-binding winged helix-turn-helix (wHTH) protein
MPSAVRAIGEVELDLGRYELRRHGRRVKLAKKPMELLIFLVARREQLVSRKDIVAKLWRSDLFIDAEPNINNIVRKIRAALGDNSAKPRFLETVVGKGYRFVGPVRVIDARFPQSGFEQRLIRREILCEVNARRSPYVHCFSSETSPMTRAYVSGLQTHWYPASEICRGWTCCRPRQCSACRPR